MKLINQIFQNDNGSSFFQYYASICGLLSILTCGMHYGWPSPTLPKLLQSNSEIPITENEGFWLATMALFGSLLTFFSPPILIENLGRKITILLTSVPYLVSWIIIAISWNVPMLYTARFIAGIADGWAFSSVPIYIGEISSPNIRGLLASGVAVSFMLGVLLINILGSYLTIKMTASVACVLPVTLVILFVWMPESPYFLIMKNKHKEAKNSLQIFRGSKVAETELLRIVEAVKEDLSQIKSKNPLDLFTVKRNYKAVLVMMLVRGAQQLSGNTAVVFYAQNIFHEAGSNLSEDTASIITFSIQFILTIVSAGVVDKLGRRPLLLFSLIGSFFALLVEGVYFYLKSLNTIDLSGLTLVPVLALIIYIICFSLGLENVPTLMLSELFNQDIKGVALCFAEMYFGVLAAATSKFFQVTRDNFGMYLPFICFSAFCAVNTILIYYFVPETKGKTLEDIQRYFKGLEVKNPDDIKCATVPEIS